MGQGLCGPPNGAAAAAERTLEDAEGGRRGTAPAVSCTPRKVQAALESHESAARTEVIGEGFKVLVPGKEYGRLCSVCPCSSLSVLGNALFGHSQLVKLSPPFCGLLGCS